MSEVPISIITVCRNSAEDLSSSAQLIVPALGAQDEWVIQDGASTDGTVEWLNGLSDARIRLESQPDSGIYDAMNRAVQRATGDYVLFLGADDHLKILLDEIRDRLVDAQTLYYGDVWRMESRDRYAGAFTGAKLARTNMSQQALFYPKTAFEGRRFDVQYAQQADWVFNMDCYADPLLQFEYLDVIVAEYAQSGISSMKMDDDFQRDYRRLLKQYFPFSKRWRPALKSALSDLVRSLPGVPAPQQTPARKT
jgi:glycosyltransferase involved in cell wall biosynthesis